MHIFSVVFVFFKLNFLFYKRPPREKIAILRIVADAYQFSKKIAYFRRRRRRTRYNTRIKPIRRNIMVNTYYRLQKIFCVLLVAVIFLFIFKNIFDKHKMSMSLKSVTVSSSTRKYCRSFADAVVCTTTF